MDVAKEVRAEAERLSRLADDIESGKDEHAGFTIEVRNPAGKVIVTWPVTKVERIAGAKRYVAGSRDPSAISPVYGKVCDIGAGVL